MIMHVVIDNGTVQRTLQQLTNSNRRDNAGDFRVGPAAPPWARRTYVSPALRSTFKRCTFSPRHKSRRVHRTHQQIRTRAERDYFGLMSARFGGEAQCRECSAPV